MKKVLLYIAIIILISVTIKGAAAANCAATWLPDGTDSLSVDYTENAVFDWYSLTAYTGLHTTITMDTPANDQITLFDAAATKTYDGGRIALSSTHYTDNGLYTITVSCTDVFNHYDQEVITLTVSGVPQLPPTADFTYSPATPEENELVTFTDTSSDADGVVVSYAWSFGDGTTSTLQNPTHTYTTMNTYTVSLTVTDDDGLTDTATKTITVVDDYVDEDFTSITITANPDTGYAPLEVTFTCDVTGGNNPISYAWSFGDGTTSTLQNPTHTYTVADEYTATCTATDNDGDTISDTIAVNTQSLDIILDGFGCNPDVVQGHEERCSAHVSDSLGNNLQQATVTIMYTDGSSFGVCTTNVEGYCSVEKIINLDPATYTVEALATKDGYVTTDALQDSFKVWEERYYIDYLELFEDPDFEIVQDTFYRSEDIYAAFAIYDTVTGDYVCDTDLVNNVFLKVHNENEINFTALELTALSIVEPTLLERFLSLFGADTYCAYAYVLPEIPLTDDVLGDGKVFAFTFNFSDATAGQATKEVTILNNPLSFNMPDEFTIIKQSVDETGSIQIDFKDFVSDVETAPEDVAFGVRLIDGFQIRPVMTDNGVFTITALAGTLGDFELEVMADDTDGSVITEFATVHVVLENISETYPPVAIIDVAATRVTAGNVITFDGSASYDPDGGDIVAYHWDFGNGLFADGETVDFSFATDGRHVVTLTVTDDEGENATDMVIMAVDEAYNYVSDCTDGRDNDGDGLIDAQDPGCQDSGYSEFNYDMSGIEEGIKLSSFNIINVAGTDALIPGDLLEVNVVVKNTIHSEIEDLRVSFVIPDLGVKQKGDLFDLRGGKKTTKSLFVDIPFDAAPGLYYAELTIANDDLRKVTHQELSVLV